MKHRKKKKGASLIIVLMVLAVVMIFSSVTLTTISKTTKSNTQEKQSEDVLFSAESGLEYGIAWFNKNKTTGVISVPSINGCTYDVKVEPYGSDYRIISKATINGKSKTVSVKVNRIERPGAGGGAVTLDNPVALIIPNNSSILYAGIYPVNQKGVNPLYHINNVLNYADNSKIYNIIKDNWGTDINPQVSQNTIEKPLNIQYNTNTLTPFQYTNQIITIPNSGINYDIEINKNNLNQYITNNSIMSKKKVTIKADDKGEINLNNLNINADIIEIIGYKNVTVTNCNLIANQMNFGESGQISFINSTLKSKKIKTLGSNYRIFNNTKLLSDEIIIEGSNEREFKNGTEINSKTFTLVATNPTSFDNVKISSVNFTVGGDTTRSFTNCEIKANNISLTVSNGSLFKKTNVVSGKFIISGSCPKVFEETTIVAYEFSVSSTNDVEFNNCQVNSNILNVVGETYKKFSNSVIVGEEIKVETTNTILFENTLTVSNKISYKGNDITFKAISDKNIFNNKFIAAQKYLKITGEATPPIITYEIDNSSIKYE